MKSKVRFSIIVPTYNSEKYIRRLLISLLNQTYYNFEIIIIDGNSLDNTCEIIDLFGDDRIHMYSSNDNGVYDAMNKGLSLANGEWIYFIGSDDWLYHRDVLKLVNKKLMHTSFNVVYGNVLIQGDSDWAKDQEVYSGKFSSFRLVKKNICHQSIFYRNSFLKKNFLFFDLKYPVNSDWDYNLKCISITKFLYIDFIVANFSSGGLSTNSKLLDNFYNEIPSKYSYLFPSRIRVLFSRVKKIFLKFF